MRDVISIEEQFPDERERGETRLRQCQLVMLRMLKILDHLCRKHGIEYFLVGGSLLGAVRHQGFIPWDDDLDVGMTRANYERFCQLAVSELPNDIFFQTPDTDLYFPECDFANAKLRDKYSSYTHINTKNNKWHEGLQLDIFVYDRAFLPHNFFIITQKLLLNSFRSNHHRARVLQWVERHVPLPLVYASNYLQSYGLLKLGANYIKAGEVSRLVEVPFEDMQVFVPQGWDACWRRQYGYYMQLPPVEKRVSHHDVLADPFTPCEHEETLKWKEPVVSNAL